MIVGLISIASTQWYTTDSTAFTTACCRAVNGSINCTWYILTRPTNISWTEHVLGGCISEVFSHVSTNDTASRHKVFIEVKARLIVAQPEVIGSWRSKGRVALRYLGQAESLPKEDFTPITEHKSVEEKLNFKVRATTLTVSKELRKYCTYHV